VCVWLTGTGLSSPFSQEKKEEKFV